MISYFLFEQPWLSTALLVAFTIVGPFVGIYLAERPLIAWLASGLSLAPVILLTFIPYPRPISTRCTFQWSLPTPGQAELMANVILFAVPALLFCVASQRAAVVWAAAVGLSVVTEMTQALVPETGRSCDASDVLSNAIGAAIGVCLGIASWKLRPTVV